MYRRILIAADPEGLAAGAAPAVAAIAEAEGAQVHLLTIDTRGRDGSPGLDEAVRRLEQELEARHFSVQVERREAAGGKVADEIAAAAGAFQADLIVLGSHRHGDVAGFFVGSVGRALASQVSTPILVVSGAAAHPPSGPGRILVAVDGGPLSHEAVVAAAAIARPGTEVTALYVDNPAGGLGAYQVYVDPTPTEIAGTEALDDAMKTLSEAGITGHARRVYNLESTGDAIARTADELDADLIVLGSRRPGNVEALLLGSVAHAVIARTRRAVLLAPVVEPGSR